VHYLSVAPRTKGGGDRSVVEKNRQVRFTSIVCKQMKHGIAGYIRRVWEMSG